MIVLFLIVLLFPHPLIHLHTQTRSIYCGFSGACCLCFDIVSVFGVFCVCVCLVYGMDAWEHCWMIAGTLRESGAHDDVFHSRNVG